VVPTDNNSQYNNNDYDENDGSQCKKLSLTPLSPTHYQQPPTPEHPPPAPHLAEKCIHERIRPLSQEYKRRSFVLTGRDISEYGTSPPMHDSGITGVSSSSAPAGSDFNSPSVTLGASNGSLSSSVSLSDRSASTDCVEEFIGDVPFAGECIDLLYTIKLIEIFELANW
jgi:ankyrin repeat and SAM domain-containing protein 1